MKVSQYWYKMTLLKELKKLESGINYDRSRGDGEGSVRKGKRHLR